jgi:hypothetical protein
MVKILNQLCQCHFPEKKNTQNSIFFSIDKAEKYQSAFFWNGGSNKKDDIPLNQRVGYFLKKIVQSNNDNFATHLKFD